MPPNPIMHERQLFLLSPYRLPTSHQIYLNEDEMAAWLNGYGVLWHPALLRKAAEPPKIDSSYEHDLPKAGDVFAIPEAPSLFQPDDWSIRVEQAQAVRFRALPDRDATLADLKDSLLNSPPFGGDEETRTLLDLPAVQVKEFLAIGFGYLMVEALTDAMEHEHTLAREIFWGAIQQAIAALLANDFERVKGQLQEAANCLLAAREVLYPIPIYLLDMAFLENTTTPQTLPGSYSQGSPLNLVANGIQLERLAREQPEWLAELRAKCSAEIQPPILEFIGGVYAEREDALMPIESQLWNLRKGRETFRNILGSEVTVYARRRTALHPQTPQYLQMTGFTQALAINFDDAVIPNYRSVVVNWPSPDGKSVNAFTRMPLPAHTAQTFFNLVYSLHQAITQDSAPTLAFLHQDKPAAPWYEDWLLLSRFGPILGQWTTFSRYFSDALAGDYTGAANPDDFFNDYLEERVNQKRPDPVSAFPRFARQRRRLDAIWTYAAIHRILNRNAPTSEELESLEALRNLEDRIESSGLDVVLHPDELALLYRLERDWVERIAERLQSRAAENQPGYLLLNPCAFTRRVALELDAIAGSLPLDPPLKAAQFDPDKARLVVELPPLGFAWIPRIAKLGSAAVKARLRLADENTIRNEFFEAEIDPTTGCLRALRDLRTRMNRIGAQVVFNPGSRLQARSVQITSNGAALGEITAEGDLLNEQNELLARFRQRFRAWLGRPVLDIRLEIEPVHVPTGYPWHSYYGLRFAWREEQTPLMRSVHGTSNQTHHTRPLSPEYLELRSGKKNVIFFTGGLPYHQRNGTRMLDMLLVPEGEKTTTFEIALALDRETPSQPAIGTISPVGMITTTRGAPHIGPSGWLFHLDAPNLMLTILRPVPGTARAFIATFMETSGFGGSAELRCVRDPVRAILLDATDGVMMEYMVEGDAVRLEYAANDLLRVRVDFD